MTFEEIIQEEKKLSFDDGVKQGIFRGFNDGISKGREEGISQGSEKKARETAVALLKMGLIVEQITYATGLSVHEINQLNRQ